MKRLLIPGTKEAEMGEGLWFMAKLKPAQKLQHINLIREVWCLCMSNTFGLQLPVLL